MELCRCIAVQCLLINPSLKKWECMWTISRVTADSLRDAGGTIVEVCLPLGLLILVGT